MNRKRKKSGEKGKMDAEKDRLFLILCYLVVAVGGN